MATDRASKSRLKSKTKSSKEERHVQASRQSKQASKQSQVSRNLIIYGTITAVTMQQRRTFSGNTPPDFAILTGIGKSNESLFVAAVMLDMWNLNKIG